MILTLIIIMFLLLILIGKNQGLKTIYCLIINSLLIYIYIYLTAMNVNVVFLSFILILIITIVTLFVLNGVNEKTKSSFISIIITMIITFLLIIIVTSNGNFQGFTNESRELIGTYSLDINYDMSKLFIGVILIATIGTVIDTSISISTSLYEIHSNNKKIKSRELYNCGINIGKDILGTTINTLVFIYFGAIITFILWNYNTDMYLIINHKMLGQEMIEFLISIIGSVIIIPVTSYIVSYKFCNEEKL